MAERHNRLMIEPTDAAVRFRYRSPAAAPGRCWKPRSSLGRHGMADRRARDGRAGLWIDDTTIALPADLPRPAAYALSFRLVSPDGAATVDLDDIDLAPGACTADINSDGAVDVTDLIAVITEWGPCNDACTADIDANGAVDVGDLVQVILAYGACG